MTTPPRLVTNPTAAPEVSRPVDGTRAFTAADTTRQAGASKTPADQAGTAAVALLQLQAELRKAKSPAEIGYFVAITMGQQRWLRTLNIEHHQIRTQFVKHTEAV